MAEQEDYNCNIQQFQRNRYFYGKLLSVRDFETEQSYMNEKRHLLNRLVHGAGLICGLGAVTTGEDGGKITVTFEESGVAVDNCGREIIVSAGSEKEVFIINPDLSLANLTTAAAGTFYLYLVHYPRDFELVNSVVNTSGCEETCCPSRVLEDFQVIARTEPPGIQTLACPDLTAAQDGTEARETVKTWARQRISDGCSGCDENGVFFTTLVISDGTPGLDTDNAFQYLSLVYNHRMLSDLLNCHLSDFDNPHKTTAAQLGALESINSVTRDENGNINLVPEPDTAIKITAGAIAEIIIGEDHSSINPGNPHGVSAVDVDAIVSISGISNPGGNVQLLADQSSKITLATDELTKSITIGESHSSRTDNPHDITAEQLGLFHLTGGEIGYVSITAPGNRYFSISGTDTLVSVTRCTRLVSITSPLGTRIVSIASPGALYVNSPCTFAVQGVLTGGISITQSVLQLLRSSSTTLSQASEVPQSTLSLIKSSPTQENAKAIRINTNTTTLSSRYTPNAAIQGISVTPNGYGVYAYAPVGTPALYVDGTAYFAYTARFQTGMSGYVTNMFLNVGGYTLLPGHVVQLDLTGSGGLQTSSPGVVPANGGADCRIMGIVAGGVVTAQSSVINIIRAAKALTPGTGLLSTSIEPGSPLYVVTHGVFPTCKIDSSSDDIIIGDWLTASSNTMDSPGFAMKAPDNPEPGTVIGMALQAWSTGTLGNTIPVFVNIQ